MIQIIRIVLRLPLNIGSVNCYLLKDEAGTVMIDSGSSSRRAELFTALEEQGCGPGQLSLVLLTHGDFDHTGNVASLRTHLGTPVAMHTGDLPMVEYGDMFAGRKPGGWLLRHLMPVLAGFGKKEHFTPDLFVDEGTDLSEHGLHARVIALPGHSRGSIGILTDEGDLFCGDLLENTKTPALNVIMDNLPAAKTSLEKIRSMGIRMIYPGHGDPFKLDDLR